MNENEAVKQRNSVDLAIVGGGPAGLSAALVLGRMRRSIVVVDDGHPRNAPAEGVHGFLTRDGIPPAELARIGRQEVTGYGVEVIDGRVVAVRAGDSGFTLTLADGTVVRADRLLVTTGLTDQLPELPGLAERWGRDVIHCPYCHGWEVRDRTIGVLTTGPMASHQAQLLRQLSDDVTVFTHTGPALTDEQQHQLAARRIRVVNGTVAGLVVTDDRLTGVRLGDGTVVELEALAVASRVVANADWLDTLGLAPVEHPSGAGLMLPADEVGRTAVPGVWAVGNVTDPRGQVSTSVAAGAWTGAMINMELVEAEIAAAVAAAPAALAS